jgi:hypothetical protein
MMAPPGLTASQRSIPAATRIRRGRHPVPLTPLPRWLGPLGAVLHPPLVGIVHGLLVLAVEEAP